MKLSVCIRERILDAMKYMFLQAEKEFFSEFIEMLNNKAGFDYESKDDWEWICNTADCREWMLEVIKRHVDADFVEPEVRIRTYRGRG